VARVNHTRAQRQESSCRGGDHKIRKARGAVAKKREQDKNKLGNYQKAEEKKRGDQKDQNSPTKGEKTKNKRVGGKRAK